jgi:hypothetical protein
MTRNSGGAGPMGLQMKTTLASSFVALALAATTALTSSRAYAQRADAHVETTPRVRDRKAIRPLPIGYHEVHKINGRLLAGGVSSFAVGYALTALTAIPSSKQGGNVLLVPFAGPFLMMGNVQQDGPACDSSKVMCASPQAQVGIDAYLVLMAAMQIVGAGLFVTAFLARHSVLVRDEAATSTVRVTPIVTGQFAGVGLSGSF